MRHEGPEVPSPAGVPWTVRAVVRKPKLHHGGQSSPERELPGVAWGRSGGQGQGWLLPGLGLIFSSGASVTKSLI